MMSSRTEREFPSVRGGQGLSERPRRAGVNFGDVLGTLIRRSGACLDLVLFFFLGSDFCFFMFDLATRSDYAFSSKKIVVSVSWKLGSIPL